MRFLENFKLSRKLRKRRIVREAESKRASEAYWKAQRKAWADDPVRRERCE